MAVPESAECLVAQAPAGAPSVDANKALGSEAAPKAAALNALRAAAVVVEGPAKPRRVNLVAKWNSQEIELIGLDESLSLFDLKVILESETLVPPERQKVCGLKAISGRVRDATTLAELVLKLPAHKFILMGTPEDRLLVEPTERPEILDDTLDARESRTKYTAWEWQRASRGELDGHGENTGKPWFVAFVDTFGPDGPPDPAKWEHQLECNDWVHDAFHKEKQWYTDATGTNASVRGGSLRITARKEATRGQPYSSARLTTRSAADGTWTYGRIEVCAKLTAGKRGLWPAIWLMPTKSRYGVWPKSGEIDVMENVGYEPGVVRASVHTEHNHRRRGNHNRRVAGVPDAHDDFHVYAIEWTSEQIEFFIDERRYYVYRNEHKGHAQWPFDEPFHLILNVAVGGEWGGRRGIDDSAFPSEMEVAFVKVFQRR